MSDCDEKYYDNGGPTVGGELKRIRNNGWCPFGLLSEAIDNSFEAGADLVNITAEFDNNILKKLSIDDNGKGDNNLYKTSRLGYQSTKKRTSIGCYGRGIKESCAALFNKIIYKSTWDEDGDRYGQETQWNISKMEKSNNFRPKLSPRHSSDLPTGMSIEASNTVHQINLTDLDKIDEEIAHRYQDILKNSPKQIIFNYILYDDRETRGHKLPRNTTNKKIIDKNYYNKSENIHKYPEADLALKMIVNPDIPSQIIIRWTNVPSLKKSAGKNTIYKVLDIKPSSPSDRSACSSFILGEPPHDTDHWIQINISTKTFYKDMEISREDRESKQASIQIRRNNHMITCQKGIQSFFRITNGDCNKLQFMISYDNSEGDRLIGTSYKKEVSKIPEGPFQKVLNYLVRKIKTPWVKEMREYEKKLIIDAKISDVHNYSYPLDLKTTKSEKKKCFEPIVNPQVIMEAAAAPPISEEEISESSEFLDLETKTEVSDDDINVMVDESSSYSMPDLDSDSDVSRINIDSFNKMCADICEKNDSSVSMKLRELLDSCIDNHLSHISLEQKIQIVLDIYSNIFDVDESVYKGEELQILHAELI